MDVISSSKISSPMPTGLLRDIEEGMQDSQCDWGREAIASSAVLHDDGGGDLRRNWVAGQE
jgi:hypothetical protein